MKTVKEILEVKGTQIFSISADAKVYDALKLLAKKNIGALVVLDNEKLTGILSERDYARKVILQGKRSKEIPVREIMTQKIIYVQPSNTAEECLVLMTNKKIRHLPVIDNDKLIGLISIGDVVKEVISHHDKIIEQLEEYITVRR
jgi:CBS domain-containing protein